jgi:RNA polymerase sigma-54 factor
VGPALGRAIALLRLTNVELCDDATRAAFLNPFLRVAGGAATDSVSATPFGLYAHALGEIALLSLSATERRIAEVFVEHLEPSGWLGSSLVEVAARAGVTVADAASVLARLQEIDPAGLFARSLAECLRIQARDRGLLTRNVEAVLGALNAMSEGGLPALAKASGLVSEAAAAALAVLRQLDPKPGTRFLAEDPTQFRQPDILAARRAGCWRVELNPATLPEIELLVCRDAAGPAERQAAAAARSFVRMVERRNATIHCVARTLVSRQDAFLSFAAELPAPLSRAEVADEAGVHESTVSRLAQAMTIETPRGVLGLSALFARRAAGNGCSLGALRKRVAALVAGESPDRPLSDAALAACLAAEGIAAPRRTIARHRKMLGVPSRCARRRLHPA